MRILSNESGNSLLTIIVFSAVILITGLAAFTRITHDKKSMQSLRTRTTIVDDRRFIQIDLVRRALPKP